MRYILKEEQSNKIIECLLSEIKQESDVQDPERPQWKAKLELRFQQQNISQKTWNTIAPFYVTVKYLNDQLFFSADHHSWIPLTLPTYLPGQKPFLTIGAQHFSLFQGSLPSNNSDQQTGSLTTKIPGKIVKILVKKGDQVTQGQPLLILEAMKMENEMKATSSGVVEQIAVSEGQAVEAKTLLISIKTT